MNQALKPIEDGNFPYATLGGVIYVGVDGNMHTDGPQWDGVGTFSIGPNGDGTGVLVAGSGMFSGSITAANYFHEADQQFYYGATTDEALWFRSTDGGQIIVLVGGTAQGDRLMAWRDGNGSPSIQIKVDTPVVWASGNVLGSTDSGLSRIGAAQFAFGDGTQGSFVGHLKLGVIEVVTPNITDVGLSITGASLQSSPFVNIGAFGGTPGDVFQIDSAGNITTPNFITSGITFGGLTAGSGAVLNEASSSNNPTLIPNRNQENTGIGGITNTVSIITTGSEAVLFSGGDSTFRGAIQQALTTVTTTTYTAASENIIIVDDDTAGSAVTITLPPASTATGRSYNIKKIGTTANVIIDGDGAETIDGSTTKTITTQYQSLTVVSDGAEWWVL